MGAFGDEAGNYKSKTFGVSRFRAGQISFSAMRDAVPLRLWAQVHAERVIGKCVLLEHADTPGTVLVLNEKGLAALVFEEADVNGRGRAPLFRGTPPEPRPALQLLRTDLGEATWVSWTREGSSPRSLSESAARAFCLSQESGILTTAGRKAIVHAIQHFYARHGLAKNLCTHPHL